MAFVHVYVCVAAAATFSGKNTRACMQFRSTQALHCWLVACTALIVPAVESCPSFTSSVEEGRAVCPGGAHLHLHHDKILCNCVEDHSTAMRWACFIFYNVSQYRYVQVWTILSTAYSQ